MSGEPLILLGFPLEGPLTRYPRAAFFAGMALFTFPGWARLALNAWGYWSN